VSELVSCFQSDSISHVFDSYPPVIRKQALRFRVLIFDVAKKTSGVDRIEETLKWGEPAYVAYSSPAQASALEHAGAHTKRNTTEHRGPRFAVKERVIGSAVRIGWKASDPDRIRLLFHCQTTLIDSFREQFAGVLSFEGNRAIVFGIDENVHEEVVARCIAASLTYRIDRKASR
jgi:hypothetical protein